MKLKPVILSNVALLALAIGSVSTVYASPERSFRVIIANNTNSFTLQQTFNHLCGGDWTPGGWTPVGLIPPHATVGIQSENSSVLPTGTEGYVKYDVLSPSGRLGMIYIYWDNPWWGVTHFRFATAPVDIYPDCDFDPPAGGSGFVDNSELSFSLAFTGYAHGAHAGTEITDLGDLANIGLAPVAVFAAGGIDKNPELHLQLREITAPPSSTGSQSGGGQLAPVDEVGGYAEGPGEICNTCGPGGKTPPHRINLQ